MVDMLFPIAEVRKVCHEEGCSRAFFGMSKVEMAFVE